MRTIIYIDGYNFYYSRLRHTPYKWLDIKLLFDNHICHQQNPSSEVVAIKYFTSNVKAKFASHGADSVASQNSYIRALETLYPDLIQVECGKHDIKMGNPLIYLNPPDHTKRINVWEIEEKQTDVHIATQMYRDASRGLCDQVVLCSNDSDLEPPLKYIREDFPNIQVGVVFPGMEIPARDSPRPISESLRRNTHWARKVVLDEELARSQLPPRVPTRRKPIDKPKYW